MSTGTIVLIVVIAAVAWYLWSRRDKTPPGSAATPPSTAASTASLPSSTPATATAAAGSAVGSYDEYRRLAPSNMVYNKLTCNRCGSNLIASNGGVAACSNCGASLYRT
jgi:hypothetical protein